MADRSVLSLRTASALAGVAALAVAGVGFWLLRNYDPNLPNTIFPPCMFKALTGFHCIGCGLTRALHALAHGDLAGAFAMNPLAILVLPLLPLMVLDTRGLTPARLKPLMSVVTTPKLWLVLLPAYWIARNLPWWPFTWLAPG